MVEFTKRRQISSLHVNFPDPADAEALTEAGFLKRIGQQFHWANDGYKTFRRLPCGAQFAKAQGGQEGTPRGARPGLEIDVLTGADLQPRHWDAFYRFYLATSDRKWGSAYLNRRFFALINERMADKIVLVLARKGADYVAGAFNILGTETIYGRNWGSHGDYKIPALRVLLLPRDRVCHHPRIEARRGRCARPAQDPAWLSAGADLQRALDPRSGVPPGRRPIPRARAPNDRAQDRGARENFPRSATRRPRALPPSRKERHEGADHSTSSGTFGVVGSAGRSS